MKAVGGFVRITSCSMWLLLPGAVSLMPSLTPSVPLAQPYASPPNTLLTTGGEKQSRAAEESIAWIPASKAPPLMYMAPNSSTLHLRRTPNRRHWESPVKKTVPQRDPQVPIYQVRRKKNNERRSGCRGQGPCQPPTGKVQHAEACARRHWPPSRFLQTTRESLMHAPPCTKVGRELNMG